MTRLTATEVARGLSELLSRVEYRDEVFEIERNGRVVARLVPVDRPKRVRDLFAALEECPREPDFADDLEAAQAQQPPMPQGSPWDS